MRLDNTGHLYIDLKQTPLKINWISEENKENANPNIVYEPFRNISEIMLQEQHRNESSLFQNIEILQSKNRTGSEETAISDFETEFSSGSIQRARNSIDFETQNNEPENFRQMSLFSEGSEDEHQTSPRVSLPRPVFGDITSRFVVPETRRSVSPPTTTRLISKIKRKSPQSGKKRKTKHGRGFARLKGRGCFRF